VDGAAATILGWGALKGALLLGAAVGLTTALRDARAAVRHAVWAGALGAALVLPVLDALVPAWRLAILPATPVGGAAGAASVVGGFAWAPLLIVGLWALGVLVVAGRWVSGALGAARLVRLAAPLSDAAWTHDAARVARRAGLARPPELRLSRDLRSPVVWGLWRPILLLPGDALGWTDERRLAVLAHELAHVRRRDCLTGSIAQAACALHWFNPLAWVAYRRLLVERERACDDGVLRGGLLASRYAGHLLDVARAAGREPRAARAALAMARRTEMEERIRAMLDGRPRGGPLPVAAVGLLSAAALFAAAFLGAIEPVHRAAPSAPLAAVAPAPQATPAPLAAGTPAERAPVAFASAVRPPARPASVATPERFGTPDLPALPALPEAPAAPAEIAATPAPESVPAMIAMRAKPVPVAVGSPLPLGSTPPGYVPPAAGRGTPSGPMASEEPRRRVRVVRVRQPRAGAAVVVAPRVSPTVWRERTDEAIEAMMRPSVRLVPPSAVAAGMWGLLGLPAGEGLRPDSGRAPRVTDPGTVRSDSGHGVDTSGGASYRRARAASAPRGNRRGAESSAEAPPSSPASW